MYRKLNESSAEVSQFMRYFTDQDNMQANPGGFGKVAKALHRHGKKGEDVKVVFSRLPKKTQQTLISYITPGDDPQEMPDLAVADSNGVRYDDSLKNRAKVGLNKIKKKFTKEQPDPNDPTEVKFNSKSKQPKIGYKDAPGYNPQNGQFTALTRTYYDSFGRKIMDVKFEHPSSKTGKVTVVKTYGTKQFPQSFLDKVFNHSNKEFSNATELERTIRKNLIYGDSNPRVRRESLGEAMILDYAGRVYEPDSADVFDYIERVYAPEEIIDTFYKEFYQKWSKEEQNDFLNWAEANSYSDIVDYDDYEDVIHEMTSELIDDGYFNDELEDYFAEEAYDAFKEADDFEAEFPTGYGEIGMHASW